MIPNLKETLEFFALLKETSYVNNEVQEGPN